MAKQAQPQAESRQKVQAVISNRAMGTSLLIHTQEVRVGNNSSFFENRMKKINDWVFRFGKIKIGITLSVLWIIIASVIYFDQLGKRGLYDELNNKSKNSSGWKITSGGPKTEHSDGLISGGFKFDPSVTSSECIESHLKDSSLFSFSGYLKFVGFPILWAWMLWFIWTRRQKIFTKVIGLLKSTNNIHKYSFIGFVSFVLLVPIVYATGASSYLDSITLIVLGLGCLVTAVVLMLISCLFVYGLFYAATRGIGMAKKKNDK